MTKIISDILDLFLDGPLIEIDSINFKLLGRSQEGPYKLVVVKTVDIRTQETNIFVYYKSNSQGLWRFCINNNGHFEKGISYVNSTLVHLKLQIFINKNYESLKEIESKKLLKICSLYLSQDEIKENILKKRLIKVNVFDPLRHCNICFDNISRTKEFLGSIIFTHNNTEDTDLKLKYKKFLLKLGKYGILNYSKEEIESDRLSISASRFNLEKGKQDMYREKIIRAINEYLEENIKISTNESGAMIGFYLGEGKLFDYDVEFNSKELDYNGEKFILYYQKIKVNDLNRDSELYNRLKDNPLINQGGVIIFTSNIILVPKVEGDLINKYGLYSQFIETGILTFKPFEYRHQAGDLVTFLTPRPGEVVKEREDIVKVESGKRYYFIGYVTSLLYPYSARPYYFKYS